MGEAMNSNDYPDNSSTIVVLLSPLDSQRVWSRVAPLLEKGLSHTNDEMDLSSLAVMISSGMMQLWVVLADKELQGVLVTEVVQYPRLIACRIVIMSGNGFRRWSKTAYQEIATYAKQHNCTRLEAIGRRGLIKLLGPHGFKACYTTVLRDI